MHSVVCIEDEPDMIELIELIMMRRGFTFYSARGGVEGLAMIREVNPDLVLLDLMMPDMLGWEVYDQLKELEATRSIPVIIVTARTQSDPRLVQLRMEDGIDDIVTKPFGPAQLIEKVDAVLAKV